MVPCDSCHIYGIWTNRSKKGVGDVEKLSIGGGNASHK